MLDLIPDTASPSQHEVAELRDEERRLWKALETLPYRHRRVLIMRAGLLGEPEQSLDDVAQRFQVTRERVRLTEVDALQQLSDAMRAAEGLPPAKFDATVSAVWRAYGTTRSRKTPPEGAVA
jgi:DNA-directed RNA polymerase sigma subunit (sigma70/sigma32)